MNTYLVFYLDNMSLFAMYESTQPEPSWFNSSKPIGHALFVGTDMFNAWIHEDGSGGWIAEDFPVEGGE